MIDSEVMVGTGFKLSVSREAFLDRLTLVSRAVSARTAVLVLGGVQLRAENGSLHIAATDMELSLRTSLEAEVSGEGEAVVPGRLLLDIARSLPEADVSIEHLAGESVVSITCGSASYRVHTYSAEDFPRLPEIDTARLQPVDRDALVETVARVGRSASRDESRPVLTGILVKFEPGKMVMAATDSYRLAVKETAVESALPELEAIIPSRALQELSRLGETAGELQLGVYENHVVFGTESTWLTTRRIDGQFPNYRQLLPEQFEHELQLPREELLDVVRRVSVMAQRNSPLRLRFADGELTVSAQTQDVGEAHESIPAAFAADTLEIGFNAEFLRDGLDSIDSQTVTFKLISPLRPAVLVGETPDYTYLIMPIRLAG
jgi:DNA polymerase III subunit beta